MGAWLRVLFLVKHADVFHTAGALFLSLVISVCVHEFGHLFFSVLLGFRVSRVVIGPFAIMRTQGRWRVQFLRQIFLASVSALPESDSCWRSRMMLVVAGGPLATAWLFVTASCLLTVAGPFSAWSESLALLSELNLVLLVLGLIPNSADAPTRNDARLFLTLLADGEPAEQIRLYHAVTCLQVRGVRPNAYPVELIQRMFTLKGSKELSLFAALTNFLRALDCGLIEEASRWDEICQQLIRQSVLRLSSAALLESGCFDLLHRNLPASGAQKLQECNPVLLAPWLQRRRKLALQIAVDSVSDAARTLADARENLSSSAPYFQFEQELLDAMDSRVRLQASRTHAARHAA